MLISFDIIRQLNLILFIKVFSKGENKMRFKKAIFIIVIILGLFTIIGSATFAQWGWKLATDPSDVISFLNGTGAYDNPVGEARISTIWKGNHAEFYLFYRQQPTSDSAGGWGWKLATNPDDVYHFLNGTGGYTQPVKDAQIAAMWKGNHPEFYIFYQRPTAGERAIASWGWKLALDPSDAMNFLNGTGGYRHPVTTARIAALEKDDHDEFYIFYQKAAIGSSISNWKWKLATTMDDAFNFVNGLGAYSQMVKGFDLTALWKGSHARFYIFPNQGTKIWLQSPLENERFVQGESVHLRALVTSEHPIDDSSLSWSSSLDGAIGQGPSSTIDTLSVGTHTIKVIGCDTSAESPVHIFADLGELYQVLYDHNHTANGLLLDTGGDVDTEVVSAGSPPEQALRTGNGTVLSAADGNSVEDYYMQFNIDDAFIYRSSPTSRVQIEIEYLDEGTDTFSIQYDAISGGPEGDGRFKDTGVVVKTDSGEFKTAVFPLCDAYFANRTNGGDFRIADSADGAEIIRRVVVTLVTPASGPVTIHHVDSCGANPFDNQPDSDAIQACIDQACSGDTVLFTSGVNSPDYQGYVIDKTIFLVRTSAKSDLTFSSTDPGNHALLKASPDLLGFVVRLFARSGIRDAGDIDNITISHLDLDGNRAERKCYGADVIENGIDDNWGSWLPECDVFGDPWCSPGTLAMAGHWDKTDSEQNYLANPERWTTGLVVLDITLANTECGTALMFHGAAGVIDSVIIDTAGDHVHVPGCEPTDPDEALGAWSDGITFFGPANLITNSLIMDPSDIGIVSFGGRDTIISNNTIVARPGNNGMFAGIAVHPWIFGLLSGFQVVGNIVINEADTTCGGIHAGINIGAHMWNAGCRNNPWPASVGNPNTCTSLSQPPGWTLCVPGQPCRVWGHIPEGATFTLADNTVTGAQVNFLVEGLDVLGELVVSGNVSNSPQLTDWETDQNCTWDGIMDSWGAIDFVAHDPTIEGWTDQRIYCTR